LAIQLLIVLKVLLRPQPPFPYVEALSFELSGVIYKKFNKPLLPHRCSDVTCVQHELARKKPFKLSVFYLFCWTNIYTKIKGEFFEASVLHDAGVSCT
jgi:hypothetical protein